MKNSLALVLIVLLSSFMADPPAVVKPVHKGLFACNYAHTVMLKDSAFIKLLDQPLCAKDSLNNNLKVDHFEITYAERGLFQDSSGLPIVLTDYSFVICDGDTIPQTWKNIFKERAYRGDTIYFDRITVPGPNKRSVPCSGVKIILQ